MKTLLVQYKSGSQGQWQDKLVTFLTQTQMTIDNLEAGSYTVRLSVTNNKDISMFSDTYIPTDVVGKHKPIGHVWLYTFSRFTDNKLISHSAPFSTFCQNYDLRSVSVSDPVCDPVSDIRHWIVYCTEKHNLFLCTLKSM